MKNNIGEFRASQLNPGEQFVYFKYHLYQDIFQFSWSPPHE